MAVSPLSSFLFLFAACKYRSGCCCWGELDTAVTILQPPEVSQTVASTADCVPFPALLTSKCAAGAGQAAFCSGVPKGYAPALRYPDLILCS